MNKEKMARRFVDWTDSWNQAFHNAIEAKVMAEYKRSFRSDSEDSGATIDKMRTFYYSRMVNTAALLIGLIGAVVAVVALLVALIGLVK